MTFPLVPAKAGTQGREHWIPAYAGLSGVRHYGFVSSRTRPSGFNVLRSKL